VQQKGQRQMVKVIDNAINESDFAFIQHHFLNSESEVPYFISNEVIEDQEEDQLDSFQFVHPIVAHGYVQQPTSVQILQPILSVIDPWVMLRLKINITHRTSDVVENGWHTDSLYVPPDVKIKSSLFYLNDNDGYTKFETGEKVESVSNRLVLFDAMEKHTGTTCSNAKYRAVVNCVYI
jgi:hypothetical protein